MIYVIVVRFRVIILQSYYFLINKKANTSIFHQHATVWIEKCGKIFYTFAFGNSETILYLCNDEKQYKCKMNFLKEKYWNSMSDDVLKMSGDIFVIF